MDTFSRDYQLYKTENVPTSIGIRLEFWKKSLRFFAEAPVVGHGTGSTARFVRAGRPGDTYSATSQVIGNPHNQTLNVAVQWGAVGVILLYAMWLVHLLLFRGDDSLAWIGLLVVVQNIFTSLFNSHIFDFHEGWMYVLGVGIAGGMTLAAKQRNTRAEPARVMMAADQQRREINSIGSLLSVDGVRAARSVRAHTERRSHRGTGRGVVAVVDQRCGHRHGDLAGRPGRDARTAPVPAIVAASDLRAADCARSLAALGTLWSDAAWGARLYAVSPATKLLFLPFLFYHFERSARGMWVFIAFLVVLHAADGRVLDRSFIPAFR